MYNTYKIWIRHACGQILSLLLKKATLISLYNGNNTHLCYCEDKMIHVLFLASLGEAESIRG
jgi:hypothetical protein